MSTTDVDTHKDEETGIETINEAILYLSGKIPSKSVAKGTVVISEPHKKTPIGLLFLVKPNYRKPFKHLLKKIQATDFQLSFPIKLSKVLDRLTYLNREIRRLKNQVMVDAMTGMYNYRFFKKQLKTEIARSNRTGLPCSLILLDIDRFKSINDAYGHLVGNEIIKGVAKKIMKFTRSIDYPARYGGDEFAVILPSTGLQEAIRIAERVRASVSGKPFELPNLPPLTVTLSGGVAEFSDLLHTTMRALIEAADKALYQAKEKGRNQIGYSEEDLAKIVGIGLRLEEKELLLSNKGDGIDT